MATEWENIYGLGAKYTDYHQGDQIRFRDNGAPGGENGGEVVHVVEATDTSPLIYVVSPNIGLFPVEVQANDVIIN